MRMWCIPPEHMCSQHLGAEHRELHMIVGAIEKHRLEPDSGVFTNGLVDTSLIASRHAELVQEMERRGQIHTTPLEYHDELHLGYVDPYVSYLSLFDRCDRCRALMMEAFGL